VEASSTPNTGGSPFVAVLLQLLPLVVVELQILFLAVVMNGPELGMAK
jgi:hypothetical protein